MEGRGGWLKEFARDILPPSILIAIAMHLAVVSPLKVDGNSMGDMDTGATIYNGGRYIFEKLTPNFTDYNRGDIVLINDVSDGEGYIIKRIIGLPGETVVLQDGRVYINNELLPEDYVDPANYDLQTRGGFILKDNEYVVLGDDRRNSNDSGEFGAISSEDILGRLILSKSEAGFTTLSKPDYED